jgi:hypothetical protein
MCRRIFRRTRVYCCLVQLFHTVCASDAFESAMWSCCLPGWRREMSCLHKTGLTRNFLPPTDHTFITTGEVDQSFDYDSTAANCVLTCLQAKVQISGCTWRRRKWIVLERVGSYHKGLKSRIWILSQRSQSSSLRIQLSAALGTVDKYPVQCVHRLYPKNV